MAKARGLIPLTDEAIREAAVTQLLKNISIICTHADAEVDDAATKRALSMPENITVRNVIVVQQSHF